MTPARSTRKKPKRKPLVVWGIVPSIGAVGEFSWSRDWLRRKFRAKGERIVKFVEAQ